MTLASSPCDADRPLDISCVERTLEAQFRALAPVRAEWFGSGCCNEVYRVNGDWVFRFPKRAGVAATVEREARLLSLVAGATSVRVPRVEWLGRPAADFPYPFVRYRLIPGIGGDLLPTPSHPAMSVTSPGRSAGRSPRSTARRSSGPSR